MTLLNENGDCRIGNVLYHFGEDGSQIIVNGADCNVFDSAKSDPNYQDTSMQRISWFPPDTCERHEYESGTEFWESDDYRNFIWRVDFDSYISNSRAKTTIRNFRFKNNRWKKAPARGTVEIGGDLWNNECTTSSTLSGKLKTKRRKKLQVREWPPYFAKVRTSELIGVIQTDGGSITIDTSIVW